MKILDDLQTIFVEFFSVDDPKAVGRALKEGAYHFGIQGVAFAMCWLASYLGEDGATWKQIAYYSLFSGSVGNGALYLVRPSVAAKLKERRQPIVNLPEALPIEESEN